jgi:hypothetical protein
MRSLYLVVAIASGLAPALGQAQERNETLEIKINTPLPPVAGERGRIIKDIALHHESGEQAKSSDPKPQESGPALPPIPAASPLASEAAPPSLAGVPLKAYETLAQAAADGINPLKEQEQTPPPVPKTEQASFDWKDWRSYWHWLQTNPMLVLKYAVAILLAFLAARAFKAYQQKSAP